jgi:hypothetical protein
MSNGTKRRSISRRTLMGSGIALTALLLSGTALAWETMPRATSVTFRVPVMLPGVTLPAGSYIFELMPEHVDVVRVLSGDRANVHFTGLTLAARRPSGAAAKYEITFGEAARGTPPPIQTWYPKGRVEGRQFIYR